MNNRQLECFTTVAEHKSFSRASELLHLTQSVVSYQVKMLERELGFRLFIRDTHKVVLTRAGENFYREAMNLRELYNKAILDSRALDRLEKNTLNISWQVFEIPTLLGALMSTFHEKFPEMQMELSSQADSDYLEDLVDMHKDIVFLYEENLRPDLRVLFVPLWTITNYFIMNKTNPLAAREHLEVEDLEGQVIFVPIFTPNTRTANEVYVDILKRFPNADIRMLSDFDVTAMPQVVANRGMALYPVPRNSQELGIVSRPFGHCVPLVIGVAYRAEDHSKKTDAMLNISRIVFANLVNI
jgi:LysR family transcriptional regulator, hca operon transcriptional activator